jgi:hypothetical protein
MTNPINSKSKNRQRTSGTIVVYPIRELNPDPRNTRSHSPKQIRQIADSIKAFGFNVPILIDRNKNILAGHGRVLACGLLGQTEVPTICLHHLTEAQARAFSTISVLIPSFRSFSNSQVCSPSIRRCVLIVTTRDVRITPIHSGPLCNTARTVPKHLSTTDKPYDSPPPPQHPTKVIRWLGGVLGVDALEALPDCTIRYQPTSVSAAAWRRFTLLFLEARIVGRDALGMDHI